MRWSMVFTLLFANVFVTRTDAQYLPVSEILTSPFDARGVGRLDVTVSGSSPDCIAQDIDYEVDGDDLLVRLYQPDRDACFLDLRYKTLSIDVELSRPFSSVTGYLLTTDAEGNVVSTRGPQRLLSPQVIPGDANFDGVFNSTDFVQVFQAAEYQDDILGNSTWFSGDWNGDREFDTDDLVLAFQHVSEFNAVAVPEPTCGLLLTLGSMLWTCRRRCERGCS